MAKHIIQKMYASVSMTRGDLIDAENAVCIEFDDRKSAVYRFRAFLLLETQGDLRVKQRGCETLGDAIAASEAILHAQRTKLLEAAH